MEWQTPCTQNALPSGRVGSTPTFGIKNQDFPGFLFIDLNVGILFAITLRHLLPVCKCEPTKNTNTILELWEQEPNKKKIARITGIPRATVTECIQRYGSPAGLEARCEKASRSKIGLVLSRIQNEDEVRKAYAYLFGLYLGDGCITLNANGRSYRLRISLDKKYPQIIKSCMQVASTVLPDNKISLVESVGHYDVSYHNKYLPEIFPQHGTGPKHLRDITLVDWQQAIVDEFPLEFFRGLYHSDGSRSQNIVKGKNYPRYFFSNFSPQIRQLFADTCDKLGLRWTITNNVSIAVSRREDVEYLDRVIGAKC